MSNIRMDGVESDPVHLIRMAWEKACRELPVHGLPPRSALAGTAIAGGLHASFLLTRDPAWGWRFRFAGRGLAALTGDEPERLPFGAIFEPGARGRIASCLETVTGDAARAEISVLTASDAAERRMVLLPLAPDAAGRPLVLGAMQTGALTRRPANGGGLLQLGAVRLIPAEESKVIRLSLGRPVPAMRATSGSEMPHIPRPFR